MKCLLPLDSDRLQERAQSCWPATRGCIVTLSVRSGFDLLLRTLKLPAGSEVLMSALTVPDMARIVEEHGLIPVPFDLEPDAAYPSIASLTRIITPNSRLVVVAHLFGQRVHLAPFAEICRQHQLMLVEDCAQSFCGCQYGGDPLADVSMFSFGMIKTATAASGAAICVSDRQLANQMQVLLQQDPIQSRHSFLLRLLRVALIKCLSLRMPLAIFVRCCHTFGLDYDRLANNAAKGFSPVQLMRRLRQQPSSPLLALLIRRWQSYEDDVLKDRSAQGRWYGEQLGAFDNDGSNTWWQHTHWVFPVLVEHAQQLAMALRFAGFDATHRLRMCVISPSSAGEPTATPNASRLVDQLVMLPWYHELPDHELLRMAEIVREYHGRPLPESAPHDSLTAISDRRPSATYPARGRWDRTDA